MGYWMHVVPTHRVHVVAEHPNIPASVGFASRCAFNVAGDTPVKRGRSAAFLQTVTASNDQARTASRVFSSSS